MLQEHVQRAVPCASVQVGVYVYPSHPGLLGLLCRRVDVQGFNLQGPLPSSLTTLSKLSTLILGGNMGITHLPSNLKSLTKLTYVVARSRSSTRLGGSPGVARALSSYISTNYMVLHDMLRAVPCLVSTAGSWT